MAKVVDLERRKGDKLADQIERQLAVLPPMSRLHVPISEVEDPQRWRRAARLAAHRLGWRVATGVSRHGFVWLPPGRFLTMHPVILAGGLADVPVRPQYPRTTRTDVAISGALDGWPSNCDSTPCGAPNVPSR